MTTGKCAPLTCFLLKTVEKQFLAIHLDQRIQTAVPDLSNLKGDLMRATSLTPYDKSGA